MLKHPSHVTPFSREGLPRLPRASLAGTRALARARAHLPREVAAPLRRIGMVQVQPVRVSFVTPLDSWGVVFTLDIGGERGRLTVEPLLALRLVAVVLGLTPPIAVRPLGRAERGTLAAVVAAFLYAARADGAVRVSLEDTGPLESKDVLSLELRVRMPGFVGTAHLDLPARLLPSGGAEPMAIDPRLLSPLLTIELGRTTLPAIDLAAAEPGDAVVFEGSAAVLAEAAWPVEIRFGEGALPGELDPNGTLRRRGPLLRKESEISMSDSDANITAPVPALALSDEARRALASAPVEIVAEIGRLTVRGDELVGLVEGGVLALGSRRPVEIVLRVGGRPWANGELVAVDDELAVRITALVR